MLRFRPGPLLVALGVAAVFVALRLAYRVAFGGADGGAPGGTVLFELPDVRLGGPFAHVRLGGATTLEGLARAASTALPFSASIVAFGAVAAIVDLSRLATRWAGRGPVPGLARSLALALATLPGLVGAARDVAIARRLRALRGVRSFVVPVLEQALERAVALAAALEVRGFAATRQVSARSVQRDGAASWRDLRLAHGDAWSMGVPDAVVRPGCVTIVEGPTGSGKSTLLRAIAGLHEHVDGGLRSGTLRVFGRDRAALLPREAASLVGVVSQRPRTGFLADRVRDELDAGLAMRRAALPRSDRRDRGARDAERVAEIARELGIAALLDRRLETLSAGEAMRVAIGAALAADGPGTAPRLLLLDEPLADLDRGARDAIVPLLGELAHRHGHAVVVAEHRAAELAPIADACIRLGAPVDAATGPTQVPDAPDDDAMLGATTGRVVACSVRGLSLRHGVATRDRGAPTHPAPRVDVDLAAGDIVALVGPNGVGKSTLLQRMALPRRRPSGAPAVAVAGDDVSRLRPSARRAAIALVPERVDDLFVADRVELEESGAAIERFLEFARHTSDRDRAAVLARHPRDLSAGQRVLLAIALQLDADPRVLLVDEPTRGLDTRARAAVVDALRSVRARGTAVLVATHDEAFADELAARRIRLSSEGLTVAPSRVASAVGVGVRGTPAAGVESIARVRAHEPARVFDVRGARPGGRSAAAGRGAAAPGSSPRRGSAGSRLLLVAASAVAAIGFAWPLAIAAVPGDARTSSAVAALALVPVALVITVLALDRAAGSAKTVALLGVLAAVGTAARIAGTGVGGVELVFIVLILGGRAYGARFGMLLGLVTIALSSAVWGGFGPWTPFQMFACAWVGAIAGLLPGRRCGAGAVPCAGGETALLAAYGIVASYGFGLVMNLWFWPFAVGSGTGISYDPAAPFAQNLASFAAYSLVTSTLTWDTVRAVTTAIGLAAIATPALAALRRAR